MTGQKKPRPQDTDHLSLRMVALAAYTKGGIGDVRALEPAEFDRLFVAMLVHADLVKQAGEKAARGEKGEEE